MLAASLPACDAVAVLGFKPHGQDLVAPPLDITFVPVGPTGTPNDLPKPPVAGVQTPRVGVTHVGTLALEAAARSGRLDVVWQDCKTWEAAQAECSTAVHLAQISPAPALLA